MKIGFGARFRWIAALILILILFDSGGPASALAQTATPPVSKGSPTKVFFADCGHYLGDRLLVYWRTQGREQLLGCPISEEFIQDGMTFQYFSKARVEYHPENSGTAWEYSLGVIGTEIFNAMSPDERANPAYKKVESFDNTKDRSYFADTGHSISFGFKEFWTNNNGLFNFGLPISEEYPYKEGDKSYSAQDFERVRLIFNPSTGVVLANIGALGAKVNNVDLSPLIQDPLIPAYSPALWEHWIEVNLSTQTSFFYEGDTVVRKNLVTTGLPSHATPTGTFYILRRVYNEHMSGGSIGAGDYYDLSNVLYTQYFTNEGHALHYAWWRSTFGYTGSHGCVNMDLDTSFFAWNWLGVGSRVVIHY
ncbi:MAG: L,D-transpeptidase [Chloroflexota bacterium]|nr:L,D-transpeptidase [Chloroflexota bacterium]